MGTRSPFPGLTRGRGLTLTTHPHLVPRPWMSRSYTSLLRIHGVLWDCFTFYHTSQLSCFIMHNKCTWNSVFKWRKISEARMMHVNPGIPRPTISVLNSNTRSQYLDTVSPKDGAVAPLAFFPIEITQPEKVSAWTSPRIKIQSWNHIVLF
jgi:hypothetical protein